MVSDNDVNYVCCLFFVHSLTMCLGVSQSDWTKTDSNWDLIVCLLQTIIRKLPNVCSLIFPPSNLDQWTTTRAVLILQVNVTVDFKMTDLNIKKKKYHASARRWETMNDRNSVYIADSFILIILIYFWSKTEITISLLTIYIKYVRKLGGRN